MIPAAFDQRLLPLLSEPGVTDVMLSGGTGCWVVKNGKLEGRANPIITDAEANRLAVELIGAGGRALDVAHPFADVVIGDFRIHAALSSACSAQTQISIRYLGSRPVALDELQAAGMFSAETGRLLRWILAARKNFLICGPTGSGKTTLLRAMLAELTGERVITIEDLPELRLGGSAISLLARRANSEGRGEVQLGELLVESLRMRPDRLVVGELRSRELLVLLQALNSGHAGSGATIHANSLAALPSRLHGIAAGQAIAESDLDSLIAGCLDFAVQLEVRSGTRVVSEVGRIHQSSGRLSVEPILSLSGSM